MHESNMNGGLKTAQEYAGIQQLRHRKTVRSLLPCQSAFQQGQRTMGQMQQAIYVNGPASYLG